MIVFDATEIAQLAPSEKIPVTIKTVPQLSAVKAA